MASQASPSHGHVEQVVGLDEFASPARQIGVARRGKGNRLGGCSRQQRLELHLLGAKPGGRAVGDIVGDGVDPPLQRQLRRERDIEARLHQRPPSFRFCSAASRPWLTPAAVVWPISMLGAAAGDGGILQLPQCREAGEERLELRRIRQILDVEPIS